MRGLDIDAERRTAWAQTGLTAAGYTAAAGEHGLATGFGDAGSVGLGGITLSGGVGFLVRKHGMTIDALLAAEVVTADGRLLRVDAEHHPDLFWAIRGGGGNFGVATRLKFRLHEVDTIVGGMLVLPANADVLAAFIAEAEAAPDELSTVANVMPAPPLPFLAPEHHGRLVVIATMVYAGDAEAGERAVAPFRALATPLADLLRPMPYPEMYPPADESYRPVAVSNTSFTERVEARTAGSILAWLERSTAPTAVTQLRVLGGAMARVPADATAFAHRDRRIMANVVAMYARPEERPEHAAWVNGLVSELQSRRPGRLHGLSRRRGRGAGPRRLPGTHVGAARGGEGRVRPGQPVPAQSERPAGLGIGRLAGAVGTDDGDGAGRHRPSRVATDAQHILTRGIPDRGLAGSERASAQGAGIGTTRLQPTRRGPHCHSVSTRTGVAVSTGAPGSSERRLRRPAHPRLLSVASAGRIDEDAPVRAPFRLLSIAVLGLAWLPAAAPGATVDRDPDTGVITIVDDVATADDITVERTATLDIVAGAGLTHFSGECTVVAETVECPLGSSVAVDLGEEDDRFTAPDMPAPISVAGGPGNDEITTGLADDVLAGGPDDDILDGGAGTDDYFGETGDDVIRARDGRAERISCGADTDEANNDFVDIIAECERGIDGDADGFSSSVDCNDAVASISPGAAEVLDNGIDENCDGRDNPNLDRDADGFPQPGDCNDANPAVRPNVPEIRGNAVDENCDRRADPFAQLGAFVSNQWAIASRYTRLLSLVVRNAPRAPPSP